MMATEYETQAEDFLKRFGLKFDAALHPNQTPPTWHEESEHKFQAYDKSQDRWIPVPHGFRYVVTLIRENGQRLEFDFWGSIADRQRAIEEQGRRHPMRMKGGPRNAKPSAYDVLASLDDGPLDADEVYSEYGDMKPSRAQEIAAFNRKVRAFFTDEELDALYEIQ